ncbi:cell division protein FtsW, lipid II flippase [Anaerocolumna jejuensis DSM 15929]|uniref:Cell division protein FtsW, lipid II flippase n=1 Tax=Anaerocolumna jejuensis DSM 15929 TaxID=1121322 RepID=A0A1M6NV92_9FIRM|nr:FtsW/RodA/SpoVE family cell cycle protein [Anaerocolumna jejuensis]SHJ99657.1 cell division protein FtsW, lipid II flippase [Anaerocolumna jejuensis DSM 15929]
MVNLLSEMSKYIIIILVAIYTYLSYRVLGISDKQRQGRIYTNMIFLIFVFHFISYAILYINLQSNWLIILYVLEIISLFMILGFYQWVYVNLSKPFLYNMVFLLVTGYIMIARLSAKTYYDKAFKQLIIASAALLLCLVVPIIIEKLEYLRHLGWIYGILGILLLLVVLFWGVENYGATNWINIKGVTFQPSEFVKILFVFCFASLLSRRKDFKYIVIVTAFAAVHVVILVAEKDLGGAFIFFLTYLMMLYTATSQGLYLAAGVAAIGMASVLAYRLFGHVRVRVKAWKNPWALIDKEGYQVTQSLFAIGTGGWFGMGLTKGLPTSIPVADSDFIFSAIAEEMGGFFAVCLVLICLNYFILTINIAMRFEKEFYKLIALGFGVMYAFQVFLSLGGAIKLIPSTGVTLPFVSSGGSSVLSSVIMFSVIQGLYVLSQDRNEDGKRRKQKEKEEILTESQA